MNRTNGSKAYELPPVQNASMMLMPSLYIYNNK